VRFVIVLRLQILDLPGFEKFSFQLVLGVYQFYSSMPACMRVGVGAILY